VVLALFRRLALGFSILPFASRVCCWDGRRPILGSFETAGLVEGQISKVIPVFAIVLPVARQFRVVILAFAVCFGRYHGFRERLRLRDHSYIATNFCPLATTLSSVFAHPPGACVCGMHREFVARSVACNVHTMMFIHAFDTPSTVIEGQAIATCRPRVEAIKLSVRTFDCRYPDHSKEHWDGTSLGGGAEKH